MLKLEGDSVRYEVSHVACVEPGDSTNLETVAWDSVQARVRVTAYDTAYARYAALFSADGTAAPEDAIAGLTGALGVFAGAAAAERPLTVLPAAGVATPAQW